MGGSGDGGSGIQGARGRGRTTGREIRTLDDVATAIVSVAYLPGGKGIVTGSLDETVRLWHVLDDRAGGAPPLVRPGESAPYREFEAGYRTVGMRIVREGPRKGELDPVR